MGVTTNLINKPFNPRGNDQSPLAYNRAALYSGKALSFDGVNDMVNVTTNDLDFGASDFSVSAIVDWSGSHTDGKLAYAERSGSGSQLAAWQIRTDGSGNMIFQANTAADGWQAIAFSGVEAIIAEGLTHLTFVRVGTGVKLYINGVFYSTGTGSIQATLDTPNGAFAIGNRINSSNYWNGKITQYKVYSTALTAAQIADLYNFPEKIVPTGVANTALKLWLPMMESAGTTAYDGSGNGNHGTISGATYVNGVGAPVAQTSVIDWNKGGNVVTYSEDFSAAAGWSILTSGAGSVSVTNNYSTSPIGTQKAARLQATNGSYGLISFSPASSTSGNYTMSVWLKSNTGSNQTIAMYGRNSPSATAIATTEWTRIELTGSASSNYFNLGTTNSSDASIDVSIWGAQMNLDVIKATPYVPTFGTAQPTPVLLPAGLTTGRDITGVNLFENVRKQGALNLDGSSWAEVHDNASVDVQSFTLECWVNLEFTGTYQEFISKGDSSSDRTFELYLNSTENRFGLLINTGGFVFATQTINENQWYHVVASYDSTNDAIKGYVNSVEKLSTTGSVNPNNTDGDVVIGAWFDKSQLKTNGQIAQPRIYNRALTAEEVQRNYNAGKNIYS